jgi:hypothetical protein
LKIKVTTIQARHPILEKLKYSRIKPPNKDVL